MSEPKLTYEDFPVLATVWDEDSERNIFVCGETLEAFKRYMLREYGLRLT